MAMLSILGLYNLDPSIFNGFRVPATLDKTTVINELCLQLAELSLVYPSPSTMKQAITIWTDTHYKEWEDLEETLYYEYNPIWNVDGTVVEERDLSNKHKKTGNDTVAASGKDKVVNSGTDTLTNSGTDTNTEYVTGFNSTTEAEKSKSSLLHGHIATTGYGGNSETTYGRSDQTTYNSTDDITDTGTVTTTRQGNIGVTMTQQMIEAQRNVVQFNVTDFIIRQFKRKFCVMVY